jgi:phosphoribosylaminoimidazolecarboxamide formyltransferase / IMP cyclohydrolase
LSKELTNPLSADARQPVRRALLSVSDKTGIVEFATELAALGVDLLSTGGTARALAAAGLTVTEVADYTGFPEIMDGRVKTLHPRVHGALLGRLPADAAVMAEHGIEPIDLLVVNLYPFTSTVARPGCTYAEAVEDIDIGGPAMLRAAAKNHARVAVVVEPEDYAGLLEAVRAGGTQAQDRRRLAQKTYAHTARYDTAVSAWLASQLDAEASGAMPATLTLTYRKLADLRYGENPHQRGAYYLDPAADGASVARARQLQGKELSYNNIADADTALECARQFAQPACVIVKHANPCGAAVASDALSAYRAAYRTDPTSAFGGVIAFNRPLDAPTAQEILANQFVEVIIAPDATAEALALTAAKQNVRVLVTGALPAGLVGGLEVKSVGGGLLVQDRDIAAIKRADLRVVSARPPTAAEYADLEFAWAIAHFVKSNALVFARDGATLAVGAGQMSRIDSCRIATLKAAEAGLSLQGAALASDAFFPFRDGLDLAARSGISSVIQPGGSLRDAEVIAAADEHKLAMVYTGLRHFRH